MLCDPEDKEEKEVEEEEEEATAVGEIEIRDVGTNGGRGERAYREKGRRRATCLPDCSTGYVKLLENVGILSPDKRRERSACGGPETRFRKRGANFKY